MLNNPLSDIYKGILLENSYNIEDSAERFIQRFREALHDKSKFEIFEACYDMARTKLMQRRFKSEREERVLLAVRRLIESMVEDECDNA